MYYKVEIPFKVEKYLKNIEDSYAKKIQKRIDLLETDPRHHGSLKLKGKEDTYRTRVGKYRIVYTICDEKILVVVIDVDHRKDIYR